MSQQRWGLTDPDLPTFRELARHRRVIPVTRRLLADAITPVGLYRLLAASRPGTFILESAEHGAWSRWSFIGVHSPATLISRGGQARWYGHVPTGIPASGDVMEVLGAALEALHTPALPGLPPLTGGLVGSLGWDMARQWHPDLAPLPANEATVPEATLCLTTDLAAVDHLDGTVWLIANAVNFDGSDEHVDEAYAAATQRLDTMQHAMLRPAASEVSVHQPTDVTPGASLNQQARFAPAVELAQQAIRAGEVDQLVLSQRHEVPCPAEPLDVYRALRTINPSSYMYYLQLPEEPGTEGFAVVGASPETLVKVSDGTVMTFPIAGSRPRGATPEEDRALGAELLADPKERGEHIMLVDEARSDLAGVCEPGSVEVVDYMSIKRYSHISHICSTVTGRLGPGRGPLDCIAATFPAGTLSGAPRSRAIELIDTLEHSPRGIYGGTVGYLDFAGNTDMAIAIRTACLRAGTATVQAGAGIVADSVPAREEEEVANKAAASLRAVELAGELAPATSQLIGEPAGDEAVHRAAQRAAEPEP